MSVIRPRRTKIGRDPNNTAWARNETSFGQRFMRSQGWAPGDVLGDPSSEHAGMHSAASTGHIRVALKDDSNGLGWKPGGPDGDDALTGMDVLKDIFGRLNGKGGEEGRREMERKKGLMYLGKRGGGIAFVRGGLLVGDEIQGEEEDEVEDKEEEKNEGALTAQLKRKRDISDQGNHSSSTSSSSSESDSSSSTSETARAPHKHLKTEKKEARKAQKAPKKARNAQKKAARAAAKASVGTLEADDELSEEVEMARKAEKRRRMEEKRVKREKKRERKERRRRREREEKEEEERTRQQRVVVRSRLSSHQKGPLDSDAMKRLFMVG